MRDITGIDRRADRRATRCGSSPAAAPSAPRRRCRSCSTTRTPAPTRWLYQADPTRQAFNDSVTHATNVRLTWQVSPRHKLESLLRRAVAQGQPRGRRHRHDLARSVGHRRRLSAASRAGRLAVAVDLRLLLDANFSASVYDYGGREREGNDTRDLVRVTDTGIQSGIQSVTYRSMNWQENHAFVPRWKVSGVYVTGAHSFKVGYTGFIQEQDNYNYTNTNDDLLHVPQRPPAVVDDDGREPDPVPLARVQPVGLRAGAVDAEPPDAAGRGALRLRAQRLPAPDVRRQQVPSLDPRLPDRHRGRHHRLPRHQPAPRRHLRPDRRRQDVGEVQRRPLHRLGVERRPVDARQPDEPHPDDGWRGTGPTATATSRPTATC